MQVAIERGFEAHRASAEPDTLAAFDLAHEACGCPKLGRGR